MRFTKAVMTACFVLVTGCVGGVTDVPGGGDDEPGTPDAGPISTAKAGKQKYMDTVHATITMAKCATAGCHGQPVTGIYGFATADASAAYDRIVAIPTLVGTYTPASAAFITKIKPGPHYTATYSAADEQAINAWLAQEVTDRTTGPNPMPVIDPVAKLREFSGCMKLADFQTAQMAQRWGQLAADNQQRCANCHGAGAYSFMTGNGNADTFFTTITTQKDLLLKYFTVDSTGKVVINNAAMQNAGVAIENHPRFNPTTNNGMTALTQFYNLAEAHRVAVPSTCDPPRLPAGP